MLLWGRRTRSGSCGFLGALMVPAVGTRPRRLRVRRAGGAAALVGDLVAANQILYDQGAVDGFGHVSARHDKDPNRDPLARWSTARRWSL